ncbi:MAG: PAS domain S-box protein [Bacteroidetes bacterium]|nr:MAG: PAS domain S-box protein [Bacteroidota bacterium]
MEFIDTEYWKALFEESPIGIAFVSEEGKWLKVNDTLCQILGYSRAELEEMDFQRLTHPEDLDADLNMTKRVREGRVDYYEMLKRYITKSGRIVWIRLVVHALKKNGKFDCFVSKMIPLVNGERIKALSKDSAELESVKYTFRLGDFVKENWKWVATALVAICGFFINTWIEFKDREKELDRTKATLEEVQKTLKELQEEAIRNAGNT